MDNRRTKERHVINKIYELKAEIQSITNELEDPNPRFSTDELYDLKDDLKKLKEVQRTFILKLREINPQSSVLRNTLQIHNSTILLDEEEKVFPFEIQHQHQQHQQQQMYNNATVFGKKKKRRTLRKTTPQKGNRTPKRRGTGTPKRRGKGTPKRRGKGTPKRRGKGTPQKGKAKPNPKK